MPILKDIKTNFTAGEVSSQLLGRGDLRAYANGALELRNLFIFPTGGVTRRSGLRYVDTALGEGRLIAFEFNTEQTYLIIVTHRRVSVYFNGVEVDNFFGPWRIEDIPQLAWTQSADTLLLVHPEYPPQTLTRDTGGNWRLREWVFYTELDTGRIEQPYFKFAGTDVTATPAATSGTFNVLVNASTFNAAHLNTRLRIKGKEVEITAINSSTSVQVTTIEDLPDTNPTIDWQEQAFSAFRGYPKSVAFHQDRLVLGGSRDLPNRLWFSRTGDLFNFDTGTGLDDEAIEFGILSDQVNAIRAVFSGRHLQVFTSGAEWQVRGEPLTPSSIQLDRQTRVGSAIDRYIPPVDIDGATLFVSRNKQEIREFLYTDVEQAYQANDLALLSRHIVTDPIDQDYDSSRRLLFLVKENGEFATLTMYRAESVAAWTLHETDGRPLSVAAVGEDIYILVKRGSDVFIEQFVEGLYLDAALEGENVNGATTWSGLDHLEGRTVNIYADGAVLPDQTVSGGQVILSQSANKVQIGLPFTHKITPLPPSSIDGAGSGGTLRPIELTLRIENTASLNIDVGQGGKDALLPAGQPSSIIREEKSGDIKVRAYGWRSDLSEPLWKIEQSEPLPFTLLAVAIEINVNN